MCAKHYENPTMLSRVTAKNVGDVFFETHCIYVIMCVCTCARLSACSFISHLYPQAWPGVQWAQVHPEGGGEKSFWRNL